MSVPKIKIETDGVLTSVLVDGQLLRGVRAIEFKQSSDVDRTPVLRIDLIATDMELDAVVIPALPEIYRPFYVERDAGELNDI